MIPATSAMSTSKTCSAIATPSRASAGSRWWRSTRRTPTSTLRLRGNTRPCYNVIEFSGTHVDVWRRYPFHGQEKIIQFATDTLEFEKYTARIEGEVTSRR